ncbi:MAG: hypothetical protein KDD11_04225 [Acidobacteria bacterium]|nr:hypothetical protein [Acidobacteriota bacterium]
MTAAGGAEHRRSNAVLGAAIVILAFLLAAWAHRETLLRPYVVNNDSCQHIYWMQRWQHPERFAGDLLTLYAHDYQPSGWRAFYRAWSPLIDPLVLSRWLPLFLFAGCCGLVFRFVAGFAGRFAGTLAAALFAVSPLFLQKMAGGHPRSFAMPILLLTLVLLRERRHGWLGVVLGTASLFYPMVFLLAAGTAGLAAVGDLWRRRSEGPLRSRLRSWAPVAAGILLGCALVVVQYGPGRDPRLGPTASGELMRTSPEFYARGRQAHLPSPGPAAVLVESLRRALPDVRTWLPGEARGPMPRLEAAGLLVLLALALLLVLRRRLTIPPELIALLVAAYTLYITAVVLLSLLYLPRRYVMYALPFLAVILLALLGAHLVERLSGRRRQVAQVTLLLVVLSFAPGLDGVGLDDYSAHADLFGFLRTLPDDSLIAPYPYLGDGIPIFTGRTVFLSYELSNPYFVTYWQTVTRRLDDFFDAYYAADPRGVSAFCRAYEVDYLVVDRHYFERAVIDSRRGAYFEPFSSRIREETAERTEFALASPPPAAVVWSSEDDRTQVISCSAWERIFGGGQPVSP